MRFLRLFMPAWLALLCCIVPLPGRADSTSTTLIGRSGRHNSFVITLKFSDGSRVQTIPAGTYTFVIHDYSRFHNFALGSQTANTRLFTTGIRWVGVKTYKLTLTPGTYAYACSAHYRTM